MMEFQICDSLVIGGGIAGLRAAIELSETGEVLIINKGSPLEGSSGQAQGGVAVALTDPEDIEGHYQDTLSAGKGLCREDAVRLLVEEGPHRIRELISWGAGFDQNEEGFVFARESVHQKERILRAHGDSTGKEMMVTLLREVESRPRIQRIDGAFSVDLIIHEGKCVGAYLLSEKDGWLKAFLSRVTILATGGLGQLYLRTTNPLVATGDGLAMAARAGATLEDMEFVQFHPTSLVAEGAPPFLLSEAMRGEGAILRNKEGKAFMNHYHKDAELAPRDIVARAIWQEMQSGGSSHVFLDATHLDPEFIKERFPRIYSTCLNYGLDITKEMIRVAPSMHFMMGGIKVSCEGLTTVKGLYAAGEVACAGIHGANRLASNSLLEGLVFGKKAGFAASQDLRGVRRPTPSIAKEILQTSKEKKFDSISESVISKVRLDLQRNMWKKVGILRDRRSLEEALSYIEKWEWMIKGAYKTLPELEMKNLLLLGKIITIVCLKRRESLGAHKRLDSKPQENLANQHIAIQWDSSTSSLKHQVCT